MITTKVYAVIRTSGKFVKKSKAGFIYVRKSDAIKKSLRVRDSKLMEAEIVWKEIEIARKAS